MTVVPAAHLSSSPAAPAEIDYPDLVRQAAAGSASALEELLMNAQNVAYRFSVVACGHGDEAEDVMQEALLKTYRYVDRIRQPEFFRTWLYRTVRNACLMKRRRRVGQPAALLSLDALLPTTDAEGGKMVPVSPGPSPEDVMRNSRLRRRLRAALQALPPALRQVVFLREIEGLSTREVSEVLRISEANVKTRLHRARLFLRQQLEEADGG